MRISLRSIPPANRRPNLGRLSSMRAASRTGMVFVGPKRNPTESVFVPKVIKSDIQAQREREACRRALAQKVEQLQQIVTDLEASGDKFLLAEAVLLRGQLARATGSNPSVPMEVPNND